MLWSRIDSGRLQLFIQNYSSLREESRQNKRNLFMSVALPFTWSMHICLSDVCWDWRSLINVVDFLVVKYEAKGSKVAQDGNILFPWLGGFKWRLMSVMRSSQKHDGFFFVLSNNLFSPLFLNWEDAVPWEAPTDNTVLLYP